MHVFGYIFTFASKKGSPSVRLENALGMAEVIDAVTTSGGLNVTIRLELDLVNSENVILLTAYETEFELSVDVLPGTSCVDSPTFRSFRSGCHVSSTSNQLPCAPRYSQSLGASYSQKYNYDRVKMRFTSQGSQVHNLVT